MNVNSVTSLPSKQGGSSTLSSSQLDMETFLLLLTVQLSTQNPLEPMSDRDFFAQLAQLGTVQGIDDLNSSQQTTQAAAMLGKKVEALLPYTSTNSGLNEIVEGTVKRVAVRDGKTFLAVDTGAANGRLTEVELGNILSVQSS